MASLIIADDGLYRTLFLFFEGQNSLLNHLLFMQIKVKYIKSSSSEPI